MLVEDRYTDDDGEGAPMNGRMCIVTRQSGTHETLIRFVADPEGRVVPDLKQQLPGRGCWVSAQRVLVEKAMAKKFFARALKADVRAEPGLAEEVDRLLVLQLAGMMNLARKAAQFVSGASKVEQAVRGLAALATFHALDAAPDGVHKIDKARKAISFDAQDGQEIPSYRFFTEAEMEGLLGQNAFIHACALAGQAGEGVVKRANMLEIYRGTAPARAVGAAGQPTQ